MWYRLESAIRLLAEKKGSDAAGSILDVIASYILAFLNDELAPVRRNAIVTLEKLFDSYSIEFINMAPGLYTFDRSRFHKALVSSLYDDDDSVRSHAANLLKRIGLSYGGGYSAIVRIHLLGIDVHDEEQEEASEYPTKATSEIGKGTFDQPDDFI